jgi:quercetin dioxygenase-like cupin family protein
MSTIHHFSGTANAFDWEGVQTFPLQSGDARAQGVSGKIMIGPQEGAGHFVFRYFLIEPGGYSTFKDKHTHDHGVLILHGRALLHLGETQYEVGKNDIIYISSLDEHWFEPLGEEALGFLCVIPNKERL